MDIMLDLETLGTTPGCLILSIGAVAFDPHGDSLGDKFYVVINRKSMARNYEDDFVQPLFKAEPETEQWWNSQTEEAKQVLRDSEDATKSVPVISALDSFANFVSLHGSKKAKIWGNGSDFDNAILATTYRKLGMPVPWQFWNNRCYRTLKSLVPKCKMERTGVHHNALDDACSQALHLQEILRHL